MGRALIRIYTSRAKKVHHHSGITMTCQDKTCMSKLDDIENTPCLFYNGVFVIGWFRFGRFVAAHGN
ncbi:MAG: hypothetical protein ETSY2_10330 [Candidatus Entotheonella gemina]|uniref:Uncharacterized protein n=1 Tax=Candidatus Entotheonella gemina TaxID=1429439 RepID=W4MD66_9BACT|nr:MAG: hypothetical protein ETSY2_10330 [Candidatus Entotheonella gemina]